MLLCGTTDKAFFLNQEGVFKYEGTNVWSIQWMPYPIYEQILYICMYCLICTYGTWHPLELKAILGAKNWYKLDLRSLILFPCISSLYSLLVHKCACCLLIHFIYKENPNGCCLLFYRGDNSHNKLLHEKNKLSFSSMIFLTNRLASVGFSRDQRCSVWHNVAAPWQK